MATRIDGDNVTVPGQVAVTGSPTSLLHTVTRATAGNLRAYLASLDLNAAAPIDLATVTVLSRKYVPVRCILFNPDANVSSATLGLYTAAGGAGVEIIAPTLLATLTAVGKFQSLTVAALTSAVTAQTLYPRLTVAAGVAGTADLLLEFVDLELI